MHKLRKYIIQNLSSLFISIFTPLFSIASVVFLIKLATFTAVIKLTIWEMTKLYLFTIPELLFFTIPVAFFIAATLSLYKLSNDNEIVVLFSLGIKPSYLVKVLLGPALLVSTVLFFNFFVLFPHTKILSGNYISYKKSEAQFNLSASEFGNSFGDWLLYLGKENKDGTFSQVFLFNKKKKEEILIAAKNAKLINDSGILRLKLTDGQGYSYSKESLTQINFKTMLINNTMDTHLTPYRSTLDYWTSSERARPKRNMLITDTLLSLFPVLSLFLVVSLGVVHARHQKSFIYLFLFLGVAVFYGSIMALKEPLEFYAIPVIIVTWLIGTYTIYRKTVAKRF